MNFFKSGLRSVNLFSKIRSSTVAEAASITQFHAEDFLCETSKNRKPSPIRELMPLLKIPGMISLGAGLPNPTQFPYESMICKLKDGQEIFLNETDTAEALQYGFTPGLPRLTEWIKELQKLEHPNIPDGDSMQVAVSGGCQDLMYKTLEMLLQPGDEVLIEAPCYPGTLAILKPQPIVLRGVQSDGDGMIPDSLESVIRSCKKPKILIVNPCGQNPKGCTLSVSRRTQVYNIARKANMLIIEDDPYWFVQYGKNKMPERSAFQRPSLPSLLSMDEDKRVIRLDSMSKALSAGMRLGIVTTLNKKLMERLVLAMSCSIVHTSGVSQLLCLKYMEHLGLEGFRKQIENVSYFYGTKRDDMLELAEKYLDGKATWSVPEAGMFFWFKCNQDTTALINNKAIEAKVILLPGSVFDPENFPELTQCVRASFSIAEKDVMEEGIKRFANLL